MQAVILSGGSGSRLHPLTAYYPKQLLPVGGKPVLHYVVEDILNAGIKDIIVVTSPQGFRKISDSLQQTFAGRAVFTMIPQEEPRGLAHAVMLTAGYLNGGPFLLYLGDNLVFPGAAREIVINSTPADGVAVAVKSVENPSSFGIVEMSAQGQVKRLVEKPEHPRSSLAIMGIYRLPADIFSFISRLSYSARGELELTDALQALLEDSRPFSIHNYSGTWFDVGSPERLLAANHYVIEQLSQEYHYGDIIIDSQIEFPVYTGHNTRIISSRLTGCAIGNNCSLHNVDLVDCMVMDSTSLQSMAARNTIFAPGLQIRV